MLALDHIVLAAENPEQAARKFGDSHGLKIRKGGRHENWGTFNHLAYLGNNCYIEWIGLFDEKRAEHSDNPLIQTVYQALKEGKEGMVQLALRTDQIDALTARCKQEDIPFDGPFPGSRRLPDGHVLKWEMLFPHVPDAVLPFLIQWGETENRPEHAADINKATLESVSFKLVDPHAISTLTRLLGIEPAGTSIALDNCRLTLGDDMRFSLK